jgi:redox-sensitive bicupin YhaK (pirin superfamily)
VIKILNSSNRGHLNFGWLDTFHTFSFGEYHNPEYMGFRCLRVINEDRVAPGQGFGTHPHRDMEIITYVLEGALAHKDSMGNGSFIKPGEVQRMSAGTGVTHSERNPSQSEQVHLLQIWILPRQSGLAPSYEQKDFSADNKTGRWQLLASSDAREGSVLIHQDADLYVAKLEANDKVTHGLGLNRYAWVHVARGEISLNGTVLQAGDGAQVENETALDIKAAKPSEVLLFDLP